jgi:dTDP-glucose pyrophosphorylase
MSEQWIATPDLKCIVLSAGRGRRLNADSDDPPKVLHRVKGRPILEHVVNYWKRYTQDFIFVVHYKKEDVIDLIQRLPVRSNWVEQKELRGIADALTYAAPYVSERLILVLGDCLCDGQFLLPEEMRQGIAIWETEDADAIRRSYSVEINSETGLVERVVEKPKTLPNKWCGLGYYFFDRRVFRYIQQTPPSALRSEIEITDVIQNMIVHGEPVTPVLYQGNYMNITFREDVQKTETTFSFL